MSEKKESTHEGLSPGKYAVGKKELDKIEEAYQRKAAALYPTDPKTRKGLRALRVALLEKRLTERDDGYSW